jgi:hypothetical protein
MVVVGPEEGEEHETKDATAIHRTTCKLTENGKNCAN